jgi:hypothetical protein
LAERSSALAKLDADIRAEKDKCEAQEAARKSALAAARTREAAANLEIATAATEFGAVLEAAASAAEAYVKSIKAVDFTADARTKAKDFEKLIDWVKLANGRYDSGRDTIPDEVIKIVNTDAWAALPKHQAAVIKAANRLRTAIEEAKPIQAEVKRLLNVRIEDSSGNLQAKVAQLAAPEAFLVGLSPPTHSAKTDADGKCRLVLPSGQRWVLAASATRHTPAGKEDYVWIVQVPESRDSTNNLLLSNDNLLIAGRNPLGL